MKRPKHVELHLLEQVGPVYAEAGKARLYTFYGDIWDHSYVQNALRDQLDFSGFEEQIQQHPLAMLSHTDIAVMRRVNDVYIAQQLPSVAAGYKNLEDGLDWLHNWNIEIYEEFDRRLAHTMELVDQFGELNGAHLLYGEAGGFLKDLLTLYVDTLETLEQKREYVENWAEARWLRAFESTTE